MFKLSHRSQEKTPWVNQLINAQRFTLTFKNTVVEHKMHN